MGNAPSAQQGSPNRHHAPTTVISSPTTDKHPSSSSTSASPATKQSSDVPSTSVPVASGSGGGGSGHSHKHPNLRLPIPPRPSHVSPQNSNPTSPSGRSGSGGSPRRRKSLELPDLNRLSFTPAAPVTSAINATGSSQPSPSTSIKKGGNHEITPSSLPVSIPSTSNNEGGPSGGGTATKKNWKHVLGGRAASPLIGSNTLGGMSKMNYNTNNNQVQSVPNDILSNKSTPSKLPKDTSISPTRSTTDGSVNPYFPSSPSKQQQKPIASIPIPIPGKDGTAPPPPSHVATPPSREPELDGIRKLEDNDGLVNVPITWNGGGKNVFVTGNFADNWRGRIKLKKSTHDFNTLLRLPPGQYRLKFIVDDSWRCSKQIMTATDDDGTLVNWIEVEPAKTEEELKAEWAMDAKPAAKHEDRDDARWTTTIPAALVAYQYIEELPQTMDPPEFDQWIRTVPYLSAVPQPPTLPRILDKVIVNAEARRHTPDNPYIQTGAGSGSGAGAGNPNPTPAGLDDNSILAVPNHVVLNHLTASAIKNGTLGVGTTTRYRKKYITTMFFKPTLNDIMGDSAQQTPAANTTSNAVPQSV